MISVFWSTCLCLFSIFRNFLIVGVAFVCTICLLFAFFNGLCQCLIVPVPKTICTLFKKEGFCTILFLIRVQMVFVCWKKLTHAKNEPLVQNNTMNVSASWEMHLIAPKILYWKHHLLDSSGLFEHDLVFRGSSYCQFIPFPIFFPAGSPFASTPVVI